MTKYDIEDVVASIMANRVNPERTLVDFIIAVRDGWGEEWADQFFEDLF